MKTKYSKNEKAVIKDIPFVREFLTLGTNSKSLEEAVSTIRNSPEYQADIEWEFGLPYERVISLIS